MEAHAASVEEDGWDGMLLTDTQNLSMDVFASMYLAASANSHLEVGAGHGQLQTRQRASLNSVDTQLVRLANNPKC